ncbi:DUF6056 family protein [Butyrivibrio sp. WCE2006]|uniref:DUF6056 family protein n=1 Tax=Butyrivibrio sp. WCE2006 TaxID=1410611 RepID=UPI0005D1F257|nr:DUF6056 family protein [Butyrivibrio sp. WCE2006]
MEKKIKLKTLRIVLFLINILSLLPILYVSMYGVPSADDFSMTNEVHDAFLSSGGFYAVVKAIYMSIWYYNNWTGVYFSNFMTVLAPHVFGEKFYFLGTWIVLFMFTVGLWYFLRQLLMGILRVEKHLTGCIISIIYFILIQCLPEGSARVESLFWYSGAVNYLFMFGLALLWLGFILKISGVLSFKGYKISALSVIGFLLGGANYMTALSLGIISACILLIALITYFTEKAPIEKQIEYRKHLLVRVAEKLTELKVCVIPSSFMLLGLFLSMIAPGNHKRSAEAAFNPIKAILMAIYYTVDAMLGKWLTWPVVILIAFLVPFLWKATGRIKRFYGFDHPVLFISFSFLLTAASITPPIYATGSIEAGRIQALFYMQGMLLLILSIGYMCGWIRYVIKPAKLIDTDDIEKRKPKDFLEDAFLGQYASKVVLVVAAAFIVCTSLAVRPEPAILTSSEAIADIRGGAKIYKQEFEERLNLLLDEKTEKVELSSYSVRPGLLFFSDITTDEKDWLNKSLAEYYHKKSVVLK